MLPILAAALAPMLTSLASNGLGLLGNAVLSKGQQYIEDKFGVKIEDHLQTPEGRLQLLQLQTDHEEFLLTSAMDAKKIDLDWFKAEAEDRDSARKMEQITQQSEHASFLAKNIVPVLALVVVIGGGVGIVYHADSEVRMALVGIVTMVLGYYFGTSSSSRGKDATIATLSKEFTK
jgi:hypothetical protein